MKALLTALLMPGVLDTLVMVLVAALTAPAFQLVKRASETIDDLPTWAKQLAVLALAFVLTQGSELLGVPLRSTDLGLLSTDEISALLSAALAMLLHAIRKRVKESKAAALDTGAP